MAKDKSDNRLDISVECYRVKNNYYAEPGKEIVAAIKDFLKTGMPHDDPRHTHTRPPKGAPVKYLDEFRLAGKFLRGKHFAPCPCCTPEHPKYGHGKIAWFPDEGVIRLLGPQCFAALNPEGHKDAAEELRQRKRGERDIRYLLESHAALLKARDDLMSAMEIAKSLDSFGSLLRARLYKNLKLPLWERVRQGELEVWGTISELNQKTDEIEHFEKLRRYAILPGYRILNPDLRSIAFRLRQPLSAFSVLNVDGDWQDHVNSLSDMDRHSTAKVLGNSISRARDVVSDINDLKKFVSSLATLRKWSRMKNCPVKFFLDFDHSRLSIGHTEFITVQVPIPPSLQSGIVEFNAPSVDDFKIA